MVECVCRNIVLGRRDIIEPTLNTHHTTDANEQAHMAECAYRNIVLGRRDIIEPTLHTPNYRCK
jgi:hypothetical protein